MTFKNYPSLILLLFSLSVFSQSNLEGLITSENNEPVAFANIILYNAQDSVSVYKGAVSNEKGNFLFSDVIDSTYLLKVSYVGFEEYLREITVNGDTKLQTIRLKPSSASLDEVTVNARKPIIRREIDRMVFEVENSTLSSGNTYDILKRTPGVIVVQDQLLVKNRPATVYINDRKVYLTAQELQQLLEGYSGENVKSVEVITTPPARYDAEGGAILNIVTSKNLSIGYKGSINASNTIAIKPKYNVGTNHYYKNDWLNAFASYNFNARNDYKKDEIFVEYFQPNNQTDSKWFTDFERNTETFSHSLNTILDFTLSEKSSLNLSANILITPKSDSDIDGLTEIFNPQGQLDSLYTTDSKLEKDNQNFLLSTTYSTEIGENGANLSVIANYIDYDNNQSQFLLTEYFSANQDLLNENSFFTEGNQNSQIYTGQIDLTTTFLNMNLETGLKYSGLNTKTGQEFFDTNNNISPNEIEGVLSDNLDYEENILAAYFSLSKDWDKWAIQLGLRGENTNVEGVSDTFGLVNSQDYFELFPTLYLLHTPNENHSYALDFSRRLGRPSFQNINTYRYFLNENNFTEGNPNLTPQFTNKINFNYIFKNKLSFNLYWERIDSELGLLPYQNNENRTLRTIPINKEFGEQYSLDIEFYDFVTEWWYFYGYFSFFNLEEKFEALESEQEFSNNELTGIYFSSQNAFYLDNNGTFSSLVNISFLPNFISGSYDFGETQFGFDIGLRKSFLNGKLVTSINLNNIFNTMNIPLESKYLNQNNSYFAMPESRNIRFGIRYNFGNFKLENSEETKTVKEQDRLNELKIDD